MYKTTLFRALPATLLLASGICAASDFEACQFYTDDEGAMQTEAQCITLNGPNPKDHVLADGQLAKAVLGKLLYDDDGMAAIRWREGFMYVNRKGLARSTISSDGDMDAFEEGLARTRQNGKIGFFDSSLKIVIPATYDFAFPFSDGYAIVCTGCRLLQDADKEHTTVVGGMWGKIDHSGHYFKTADLPETQF